MKRITLFGILLAVGMLLAGGGARAAENIWPDPSFEATGVAGPAHSGTRAGHLQVGERVHWTCIGGDLKVEPFATYRATAWVKANVGKGNPYALFHYEWDSYQWAFSNMVTLRNSDWQQVSLTFVSPFDHIYFHPLAFIDGENCEAWIDDLVIERVQTPAETMAALIARGPKSRTETQLLARYYFAQKESGKLNALLAQSDNYNRADMAYVMAKETKDAATRDKQIAAMVRCGGPLNVNGLDRFRDVTASL
ncbi:MAG TPA: carbohydrate binding domain-containing protein, partial [Armatimonadota bacterium]|nr:carbohydrate binding domain-containing protein [Armatimonadota bacterium]